MDHGNNIQYDRESYILIVDDDQTLLKFFKIHLNKFFSRVVVANNVKEALENCSTKTIDLVISDIAMQKTSGLQLLSKLMRINPLIPVLLISGAELTKEEQTLCEEESYGFLRKPFSVEQLHEFITQGLDKREKLKRLSVLVGGEKAMKQLLSGKATLKQVVSATDLPEVEQIWNSLKKTIQV